MQVETLCLKTPAQGVIEKSPWHQWLGNLPFVESTFLFFSFINFFLSKQDGSLELVYISGTTSLLLTQLFFSSPHLVLPKTICLSGRGSGPWQSPWMLGTEHPGPSESTACKDMMIWLLTHLLYQTRWFTQAYHEIMECEFKIVWNIWELDTTFTNGDDLWCHIKQCFGPDSTIYIHLLSRRRSESRYITKASSILSLYIWLELFKLFACKK